MGDIRIKQILNYLDRSLEKLNRGELSREETEALTNFMDEIERTKSMERVRVTKNGEFALTSLK